MRYPKDRALAFREELDKHEESGRAVFFHAFMLRFADASFTGCVKRAAELGYAPAQAWLVDGSRYKLPGPDEEDLKWAQLAASQDDPRGLYLLWGFHQCCEQKANLAMLRRAAELGEMDAVPLLVEQLGPGTPEAAFWLATAVTYGEHTRIALETLVTRSVRQVMGMDKETSMTVMRRCSAECMFQIGRVLANHETTTKNTGEIFGAGRVCDLWRENVHTTVYFYRAWCEATRQAAIAWILASTSAECGWMHMSRDVRRIIAKLIWASRFEALYLLEKERDHILKTL